MKRFLSIVLCLVLLITGTVVLAVDTGVVFDETINGDVGENTILTDVISYTFDTSTENITASTSITNDPETYISASDGKLLLDGRCETNNSNRTVITSALTKENLSDFSASFKFKNDGGWNVTYIRFRVTDSNNYYALRIAGSANTTVGASNFAIIKVVNGTTTVLHSRSVSGSLANRTDYDVSLAAHGKKLYASIKKSDGSGSVTTVFCQTDTTFTSGDILLTTSNTSAYFDDIKIYNYQNKLLGNGADATPTSYLFTKDAGGIELSTLSEDNTDLTWNNAGNISISGAIGNSPTTAVTNNIGNDSYRNLAISFDFTPTTCGYMKSMVRFGITDANNYYGVMISGPNTTNQFAIVKVVDGNINTLAYSNYCSTDLEKLSISGNYTMQITVRKGIVQASLTTSNKPTGIMPLSVDLGNEYVGGSVCLSVFNGVLKLDNLRIYDLSKEYITPEDTDDLIYANDFETNTVGISSAEGSIELKENAKGNGYLDIIHTGDASDSEGWSNIKITPTKKYKDFTFNMYFCIEDSFNVNWHFIMLSFHSKKNDAYKDANVLQIADSGAAFAVTDTEQNKTYVDNRVAYSGKDSVINNAAKLPTGNSKAGINADGAWYKLSLVADGSTYKYYLNGELMMSYTDSEGLHDKGYFLLTCRTINIKIDNIEIWGAADKNIDYEEPVADQGLEFSEDFESKEMPSELTVTQSKTDETGIVTDKKGNSYLQLTHDKSGTGSDGWAFMKITPDTKYKDFTFNAMIRVEDSFNVNWNFIMLAFHSNSNAAYQNANVLQIANNGAAMAVTESDSGKTYVNNRVAYSGTDSVINNDAKLPTGNSKAGIKADGIWHRISLVAENNVYSYYYDGELMLKWEDTEELYKKGYFYLVSRSINLQIDDIEIYGSANQNIDYEEPVAMRDYIFKADFENGMPSELKVNESKADLTGIATTQSGNNYLQLVHTNFGGKGDGWASLKITPTVKYKDFTLNMDICIDDEFNTVWNFIMLAFHSQSNSDYKNAKTLQIGKQGACFGVANSESGLTYSNNRIAYSGKDTVVNNDAKLPTGNLKAGIAADGSWHKLSLVADGSTYKYYLDGELMMSVTEDKPIYDKGYFYLICRSINLRIDNLEIYGSPYMNLDYTEPEMETGTFYENTFESGSTDGLNLLMSDDKYTGIVTEEGNSFYRLVAKERGNNDRFKVVFGPKNLRDFTLEFDLRIKSLPNYNWSYVCIGFHGDYSKTSDFWGDAVIAAIAGRGSAFASTNSALGLQGNNLIAATGEVSKSVYYPTTSRDYGLRPDGKFHKVKIVVKSNTYTLFVDGKQFLTVTEDEPFRNRGLLHFSGNNANIDIDNIKLYN